MLPATASAIQAASKTSIPCSRYSFTLTFRLEVTEETSREDSLDLESKTRKFLVTIEHTSRRSFNGE